MKSLQKAISSSLATTKNCYWQAALLAALMIFFGIWAVKLGRDSNWDLLDYHYYNGYAFLHHRYLFDIAPAEVQSFINPFYDAINYLMIRHLRPVITIFILGSITGIYAYITFEISMLLLGDVSKGLRIFYSLCAIAIGATGAGGLMVLGLTTNDNKMVLLVMASLYCAIKSIFAETDTITNRWVVASGLIIGVSFGFKLVSINYAIGLGLGMACSQRWSLKHLQLCVMYGLWMVAGFLLADGCWMYFLQVHFQSPLFPYMNKLFQSPYAVKTDYNDTTYYSQHLLTLPFYWAFKKNIFPNSQMIDFRPLALYLMTGAFIIREGYKIISKTQSEDSQVVKKVELASAWRLVVVWFLSSYLIWYYTFTIYRYLVASELVAGIGVVRLLHSLIPSERIRLPVLTPLVLFLIVTTIPIDIPRGDFHFKKNKLGKEYFTFDHIPSIPDNSTVLLFAPTAYVIPQFPEKVRFVGIEFITADAAGKAVEKTKFEQQLDSLIAEHAGHFYILYTSDYPDAYIPYMKHYGLKLNGVCEIFHSNSLIGQSGILHLCPVVPIK